MTLPHHSVSLALLTVAKIFVALHCFLPLAGSVRTGLTRKKSLNRQGASLDELAAFLPNEACPKPVQLKYGWGCQCDAKVCGAFPDIDAKGGLSDDAALVVTSVANVDDRQGAFFDTEFVKVTEGSPPPSNMAMIMNVGSEEQTILGFGGAFTDAVAYNYEKLTPKVQEQFIRLHFGADGIGYSLGRVNMNAADFSRTNYVLDDVPYDYDLEHFCLRDDSAKDAPCGKDYKTTVIKAAQDAIEAGGREPLKLFVSSWSPPLWYKDQNFTCDYVEGFYKCKPGASSAALSCDVAILDPEKCIDNKILERCPAEKLPPHVAQLAAEPAKRKRWLNMPTFGPVKPPHDNAAGNCYNTGFLKQDSRVQESWAKYFSKFIEAYEDLGIKVWGLTMQNEPLMTVSMWQAMYSTPELQAEFLAKHLGPLMRAKHPEVKIMIYDDSMTELDEFVKGVLDNPEAAEFVDGVAYHWYMSLQGTFEDTDNQSPVAWLPHFVAPQQVGGGRQVRQVRNRLHNLGERDRFLLMTEACAGYVIGTNWLGPRPGEWGYGYAYSHDIMWQLRNGAAGWTDWNMLLGSNGGPNLRGNFVDSPVHLDVPPTATSSTTFNLNPSFFHLAHYSKFVVPGSKTVDLDIRCGADHDEYCQAVGFMRPDGKAVVVITNDEITVGPIASVPVVGRMMTPRLAMGQGVHINWLITCGESTVTGSIPWKSIQTVVMPCKVNTTTS